MEFLSNVNQAKDITTREYVENYVAETGGWINHIKVDGVEQPIVDKTVDIINKTDEQISGQNGVATILNGVDSAKLKFEHKDGTVSEIKVADGGENGEAAVISAFKGGAGVKVVFGTDGAYYLKNKTTIDPDADEIVTKSGVPTYFFWAKKADAAEEGYFATYHILDKYGNKCGESINIPKDFLVKSASMKYCEVENVPISGLKVCDPYLDFVINVKEGVAPEDEHLYINVKNLVDIYRGGNGIDIDTDNIVRAVVVEANGLSVDEEGIKLAVADSSKNGAMTAGMVSKLEGISVEANKVTVPGVNGHISIDGVDTTVYTHPAFEIKDAAAVKIGNDAEGHVVIGEALALSDLSDDATHRVVTDSEKALWNAKVDPTEYATKIAALEAADGNLATAINDEADRAEGKETELESAIDTKTTALSNRITVFEAGGDLDVAGIKSDVSDLDTAVSGLDTAVSGLETSVGTLETSVSGLETSVGTLETSVSALETAVSGLETGMELVNSRAGDIEGDIETNVKPGITAASGKVDTLEASLSDIAKAINIPAPEVDGTYVLKAVVADGTVTYSWVVEA